MNLKEERPLVFFDTETTGVNISKDKIISLAVVKVDLVNKKVTKASWMFNPGFKIPKEAMEIHGITDAMVADKPRFTTFSKEILEVMKSGILCGYNINTFDIPLVKRELIEAGEDVSFMNKSEFKTIDVFRIVKQLFPRGLGDMYKRYTGEELEDSHDAMADTVASYKLLAYMIREEDSIPDTVDGINEFYFDKKFDGLKKADAAGQLIYNPIGEIVYNFGKYKLKPVGSKDEDIMSYALWIINSPDKFAKDTIEIIRKEISK